MTFKAKITMDNGQSKIITMNGRGRNDVLNNLIAKGDKNPLNIFVTVDTVDGTDFTYCVGKVSTIEILDYN